MRNHLLAEPAAEVGEVAHALVALHSSDPTTVYLSAWARLKEFSVSDLERALYVDRSLVRILGMRRTLFVVPSELGPVVHCSSTESMIDGQRKRVADLVESAGLTRNGAEWITGVSERTLEALRLRGSATAVELTGDVPELGNKLKVSRSDGSVLGTFGVSTRILFLLAVEGKIMRTKPLGSWLSSQYVWAPVESWMGGSLTGVPRRRAQARIVEAWLHAYGPGTEADIKWWTGWSLRDTRRALLDVGAAEVETAAGRAFIGRNDEMAYGEPEACVALLPSLDPTVMGWRQREWYLGDHAEPLFDRTGNAGPTVWVDGRAVGAWAQRSDGEVLFRILEDVGAENQRAVAERAAALQAWLGDTVVTPRFRSILEKELATA